MNEIEIKKRLNELKEKKCQSVWIIKYDAHHIGAKFSEITNDVKNKKIKTPFDTFEYSEIRDIMFIY